MNDTLLSLAARAPTRRVLQALGLPTPVALRRAAGAWQEAPLAGESVLLGQAVPGRAQPAGAVLAATLRDAGALIATAASALDDATRPAALVWDATGIATVAELSQAHAFFHPLLPRLAAHGRVVVVTGAPADARSPEQAACWRGLEGFVRSLAKETGARAATANLVYVGHQASDRLPPLLRFLVGPASAYVDGQPLSVTTAVAKPPEVPVVHALAGKVAVVTGAARGIGEATARRLALEGARVVCVDVPAAGDALARLAQSLQGEALTLDMAAPSTPAALAHALVDMGGVDVLVHNAGITRDRTLARMPAAHWDSLLELNLAAILRVNEHLLERGLVRDFARIVCLSSISGIAGNRGQTNYATAKAGLIGYVAAEAPRLAPRGICINAVAPGFVETQMTAQVPFLIREAARRMNALSQGAQPIDIAEAITFLASPGCSGISGQTLRVCGQALLGA